MKSMKLSRSAIAITALAAAVFVYLLSERSAPGPSSAPAERKAPTADNDQLARLTKQIEGLQQKLAIVETRLGSQQNQSTVAPSIILNDSTTQDSHSDVDASREAAATQHHAYVAGVAQTFAEEEIDPAWAEYATSRIKATLASDEARRGLASSIECRRQTCRVEIADTGSGRTSDDLRAIIRGVVDVLPAFVAERVDQGNGRSAMVLYMSNQQPEPRPAPRR